MPDLQKRREVGLGEPSVVLDIALQASFHTLIVFGFYLHMAGHNAPGGGFIAGLVIGGALTLRFITGRPQIQSRTGMSSEVLLGIGVVLAAGTALVPMFFGQGVLEHSTWEFDLPVFGDVKFITTLIFDTGILLVVVGVIATLLEVLGSEGDDPEFDPVDDIPEPKVSAS